MNTSNYSQNSECPDREKVISIPLGHLVEGHLISRPNRFLAIVDLHGEKVQAHVSDSGRLEELLFPGNKVMIRKVDLSPTSKPSKRKTEYDLVLAASDDIWVCIDTRYPNDIFEMAVKGNVLQDFCGYEEVQREVSLDRVINEITSIASQNHLENEQLISSLTLFETNQKSKKTPKSRFDFFLSGPSKPPLLLEVKSVNLCVDGTGLFPDAPTQRGTRHVRELCNLVSLGLDSAILFVAQREDVKLVSPHRKMDPDFSQAMDQALEMGVKVVALRCIASPLELRLDPDPIPYIP
ncbi:MAG TPA: DNA/RNA nuclease SfsA [Bacillota bacterium]|nr:DNA/RNA nuclease SfsA [Bacillota bacterium]